MQATKTNLVEKLLRQCDIRKSLHHDQMQGVIHVVDIWNPSGQFILQQFLHASIFAAHYAGTVV